jgi:hypothetical protein
MFTDRTLLIVTKHKKEQVIAPLFETALGVRCMIAKSFDTDTLGTFTGEVERKDDPTTTARNKCLRAMELYHCDLAIASEGSFGAHPTLFFVPADDELLCFIDKRNNLEILAREVSLETNFDGEEIRNEKQLQDFAMRVKFPAHGVIIRKSKEDISDMIKGITDWTQLTTGFNLLLEKYRSVYIETDMRAMYNPTRMKVIESAAHKLVKRIISCCPHCHAPGFGITDVKSGLPCKLCGSATRATLSHLYQCQKCSFMKEEKYPNHLFTEDPSHCDRCNP